MSTLIIARLTFQEARQRKLLWVVLLIGLAFLLLFSIGFFLLYREVTQTTRNTDLVVSSFKNLFSMLGLYVINFLVVLLAVLTSAGTIAGEVDSGTIQTIITKPLRRWEVVLGKWLGLAGMLATFTVAMSAGLFVLVWLISGYVAPHPVEGVALMVLNGLVLLTLSILGSTRLSALNNGAAVFMLYGLAFIAGWIEYIGAIRNSSAAVNVGIVVSLLAPCEVMWKRAAYLMQPAYLRELAITPFASASAPSEAMVIYTALYILCALLLALRSFQRRDL
jgi:ABC-type transport system involved in multi-copper enzyme maturation permease subunit